MRSDSWLVGQIGPKLKPLAPGANAGMKLPDPFTCSSATCQGMSM